MIEQELFDMEDFNLFETGPTGTERKHLVEDARYAFKEGASHQVNVGETERWLSAAGGTGMVAYGLKTRGLMGLTLGAIGAMLLYRGLSGHCSGYSALGISTADQDRSRASLDDGIKIEESIFVAADQVTLFQYWRNLSNLPNVMSHLKTVTEQDNKRSHWVAKGPMDTSVEWDAEIINERENELIAWRSLEGSQVANAGSVRFTKDNTGAGTMVKVSLLYNPPAGRLGKMVSSMLGEDPAVQISQDLKRFKEMAEAGKLNGAATGA
jgi:uncharacterized membrane protein